MNPRGSRNPSRAERGHQAQAFNHFWLLPPEQSQSWSWAPLALFRSLMSTHLFAETLTRSPAPDRVNRCTGLPLQATNWIGVPLARVPPAGSMHLPIARRVPSPLKLHCWAAEALQSQLCRRAPSAGLAPGMSMHRPLKLLRSIELPEDGGGGVPPLPDAETRTQSTSIVCGNDGLPSGLPGQAPPTATF